MKIVKKQFIRDRKKLVREYDHLTVPPRLEGVVRNAKMYPLKKPKRILHKVPYYREPKIRKDPKIKKDDWHFLYEKANENLYFEGYEEDDEKIY